MLSLNCTVTLFPHLSRVINILLISHHVLFPLFGGFGREAMSTLWSPSICMLSGITCLQETNAWNRLLPAVSCLSPNFKFLVYPVTSDF